MDAREFKAEPFDSTKGSAVVVTQDIGLASMTLGRAAEAIDVHGCIYDRATIDMQLFIRHEQREVRRAGGPPFVHSLIFNPLSRCLRAV